VDVWRLTPARHSRTPREAFSGRGARLYGGRWNSKGVAVVYGAESLSLAALETLVHLDLRLTKALDFMTCVARCPDDISHETRGSKELPAGWNAYPAPRSTAEFGDAWVREARSALLLLPSALVPRERIILLNPLHPDFGRIRLEVLEPFQFDPRLLADASSR